jgi:hypothetical protein
MVETMVTPTKMVAEISNCFWRWWCRLFITRSGWIVNLGIEVWDFRRIASKKAQNNANQDNLRFLYLFSGTDLSYFCE